jgi:hypothetical protein
MHDHEGETNVSSPTSLITEQYGRPCYTLKSDSVNAYITIEGAALTADFRAPGTSIRPYFVAPWWNEGYQKDIAPVDRVSRGSFFCLPFGGNVQPFRNMRFSIHGVPPNNYWTVDSFEENGSSSHLALRTSGEIFDSQVVTVTEEITLYTGQPLIYVSATVSGIDARMPAGFHPTLQLQKTIGGCVLDVSSPVRGYTPPKPIELPENLGYSLLKPAQAFSDLRKVETVFGSHVDISNCPFCRGFEDIAVIIANSENEFTFAAVTYVQDRKLYFQLKNPRNLSSTMLWMSNGGRYYPPWSGRVFGALGIEEVNSFFHYGIKESVEDNYLANLGVRTADTFSKDNPKTYRIIMGAIPVPQGFSGVKSITRNGSTSIVIRGKKGETLSLQCEIDFLDFER